MELTPEEDPKSAENERRKYKEKENKNSGSRRRRSRSRSKSRSKTRSRSRSRKNGRKRDRDSQRNDNGNSDNEIVGERFYGNYQRRDQRYQRKRGYESQDEMEIGERYYGGSRGYSRRKSRSRSRERFKDHSRRDREDGRRRKDYRGNGKEFEKSDEKEDERAKDKENNENSTIPPAQKRTVDLLTSRTGGAYIPPAKLRMMQAEITDKSGEAYQRIAWEALKKSIHGYINKVNTSNIGIITRELLRENIVRGRGLLARSIIQAQAASPTFTPVYAALAAVINSKFPNIGELLLKRLVIQFKQGFRRNDKTKCISSGTFIAHLVNQKVAHEILALEILTLLVHTPTDDSVEVAIALLKECGMRLTEVCRKGMEAIFEMLRHILHEGLLDKRVQYMIEVIFQIRKDEFKDHEAIPEELDLVEEENQFTHVITLDEAVDSQGILDVFKADSEYVTNEDKYKQLIKEILDTDDSDSNDEGDDEGDSSDEDSDAANDENKEDVIVDNTETNLTTLRRTIYLTIHSSLDFEECAHKLMKIQLKPGQEIELCHMFLDCCAENRTYEKFYGLLAGRFCAINKMYVTPFEQIFKTSYDTIHRLDTNKLRNVSKFFAHLLYTDSISWEVLSCIRLNEEETTSSSRVFIKILFQELSEYMGLSKLNQRVKDITLQTAFDGLFPRDDPKNTRFAINFFTSIGLGGLTDDLREHLKSQPKTSAVPPIIPEKSKSSSSDSPSSSSSSSSSSSESESSSDSSSSTSSSSSSSSSEESSEDEKRRRKKKTSKKESKKIVEKVDKKAEKSRRRKSKDNSKKRDSKNEHKKKKKNK